MNNLTFNLTYSPITQDVVSPCIDFGLLANNKYLLLIIIFIMILNYFYIAKLRTFEVKGFEKYSYIIRRVLFSLNTLGITILIMLSYTLFKYG